MLNNLKQYAYALALLMLVVSCRIPTLGPVAKPTTLPAQFGKNAGGGMPASKLPWRQYFKDPVLVALIDTALTNNLELNMMVQEMVVAQNEVRLRRGEYLPSVNLVAGARADKAGEKSLQGSAEHNLAIEEGKENPKPIPDFALGAFATWEVDIWRKLRNSKKAALHQYFATVEGKHFMTTQLIAELANTYYELLALREQQKVLAQNVLLQTDAMKVVRVEKEASRVTELAVKRFEAQVLRTRSLQFQLQQRITEAENRLHLLTGKYQPVLPIADKFFLAVVLDSIAIGQPDQLLQNRPDVRQAEQELAAAKLRVGVARASFYPSLRLAAGLGVQAYTPTLLLPTPESLLLNMLGELSAPLVNRNGLKANYFANHARQLKAVYGFSQTTLKAYLEVLNQQASIRNMAGSLELKQQEVAALEQSSTISSNLFRAARADYMEVLLTQRDALESRIELIDNQAKLLQAHVGLYKALGGGWQ